MKELRNYFRITLSSFFIVTILWESSEARKNTYENVRKGNLFRKACNVGECPTV